MGLGQLLQFFLARLLRQTACLVGNSFLRVFRLLELAYEGDDTHFDLDVRNFASNERQHGELRHLVAGLLILERYIIRHTDLEAPCLFLEPRESLSPNRVGSIRRLEDFFERRMGKLWRAEFADEPSCGDNPSAK